MRRPFIEKPADWLTVQRTSRDIVRDSVAVEQFHKAQNRNLEAATALAVVIVVIAAIALHFWR